MPGIEATESFHRRIERERRAMSEADIQASIIEWLWVQGLLAFHIPNRGLWNRKTRRYNIVDRHHLPGIPDLCVPMKGGKTFWIECKRYGEGPTPDQVRFLAKLGYLGHHVVVAHSVGEVETYMRTNGLLS